WVLLLLLLLSPALLVGTSVALSEITFTFFLLAALSLLLRGRAPGAGLCLSAATMIRPAGIYLFVPLGLWLLWRQRKTVPVLMFIAAANILPLGWSWRNYVVTGYFTFTTMDGYYMLYYKAGGYLSWKENIPFPVMCDRLAAQLTATQPIERSREAYRLGRRLVGSEPLPFAGWVVRDLPRFLMPDISPLLERLGWVSGNRGTLDVLRRQGIVAAGRHYFSGRPEAAALAVLYTVFYGFTWLLLPFGIWYFHCRRRYDILFLAGLCLGYFWLLPAGNLDWRFRIPVIPLLLLFFTAGAAWLGRRRRCPRVSGGTTV
ncbi:MAG: hypothetical protein PHQ27_09320, partial [Victivallales bacterium]|nr:hypothetical protein [Victivallales bacterium]